MRLARVGQKHRDHRRRRRQKEGQANGSPVSQTESSG